MTHGEQYAETSFEVDLNGDGFQRASGLPFGCARTIPKQLLPAPSVNGNAKLRRAFGMRRHHHGQRLCERDSGNRAPIAWMLP